MNNENTLYISVYIDQIINTAFAHCHGTVLILITKKSQISAYSY